MDQDLTEDLQELAHKPVFRFASYDTEKYPFAEILAKNIFHVEDLSRFHESFLRSKQESGGSDSITHKDNMEARELLKSMDQQNEFYQLYNSFIKDVIAVPLFGGKLQHIRPVYRVHMAGSKSISGWHRDVDVTHYGSLITAWIPFVNTFGSNTIWVEAEYGKQNYQPVPVRYGQIFFFDSAWLWHGSITNKTESTRMGMDVRMVAGDSEQDGLGILAARPDWCVDANASATKQPLTTDVAAAYDER